MGPIVTKHAIVTGAASGIGADFCLDLMKNGWTVFGIDLSADGLNKLGAEAKASGCSFYSYSCNVADSDAMSLVFQDIFSHTDTINAVVCSAGIFRTGPLVDMPEQDFDALFAVNTKGAWLTIKSAVPQLRNASKKNQIARVLVVASIAALRPKVGGGAYAASKAALTQLVKVMAVELAEDNILVNAIAPSTVDTPLTRTLSAEAAENGYTVSGISPLGRVAEASDITAVLRFFLSESAGYISGAILPIDGATSAAFQPSK